MSTVYLGTSEFAATVLRRLAASEHRPALVVTPPDRPQGRGRKLAPPPAAAAARELGIELLQAENVNEGEALERIRAAKPSAVVVCAFGQIIREPLLSEFPILNVHPSLLPRWRGAAPIERAIMAGDERTGVCVIRLVAELDAGPVALRVEVPIAAELSAAVRALTPHIGAYLETAEGERLGVRRARAVDVSVKTGAVKSEWGALLVGCCRGALRLEVVQPPGGKPMPVDAYLRGHSLPKL